MTKTWFSRGIRIVVLAVVATLGVAVMRSDTQEQAIAQPPDPNCMGDVCDKSSPCTANDVRVASLSTVGVDDYCEFEGDTGVYSFRAEFVAGANTRYDPGVWIATDGGDAKTGQCFADYLVPPLTTTYVPPWSPYWDAEDQPGSGDECGDISQGDTVYRDVGPVTIDCNAANLDGTINTCVAWDNNAGDNCPANNACPGTGSKCRCEEIDFEVNLNLVDLALVKEASPDEIPTNGEFDFVFTVSNQSYEGDCFESTGYTIVDDLSIWLKAREPLPAECTSAPDPQEVCYDNPDYPNGCEGYGDIVTCVVTTDLACPATAPEFVLPVQHWAGDPTLPDTDPRLADPPPEFLENEACVAGFEVDPVDPNNCDSDDATPTAVEVASFTATGRMRYVQLDWETASEIDNLGFNLYRAASVDGRRTQINESLIPTEAPGSVFGAEYTFVDTSAGRRWSWDRVRGFVWGRTYVYWLEDVDIHGNTGLTGPVEISYGGLRGLWPLSRKR